jgi:hypothetical protein
MARPTLVTVLGFFQIAGGISAIVLGVAILRNPGAAADWGLPPAFGTLGAVGGAIMIVYGILNLSVGWGLLKLYNWARIIMLAITGIGLVGSAMGILLGGATHQPVGTDVLQLLAFAVDALVIWYLLRPDCKLAFTPPAPGGHPPSAPPTEPPPPPAS